AGEVERLVEVAVELDDPGTVDQGLRQLPGRNLALRDEHGADDPGPGRVGSSGGRGIAGRGAGDRLGPAFHCLRDREGHSAGLERPGGGGPLELEVDLE